MEKQHLPPGDDEPSHRHDLVDLHMKRIIDFFMFLSRSLRSFSTIKLCPNSQRNSSPMYVDSYRRVKARKQILTIHAKFLHNTKNDTKFEIRVLESHRYKAKLCAERCGHISRLSSMPSKKQKACFWNFRISKPNGKFYDRTNLSKMIQKFEFGTKSYI